MDIQSPESILPFDYLLSLEQRILENAPRRAYQSVSKNQWMALSFLSGLNVLLTPLEEVSRILPVTSLTRVPGVKSWLRGLATYRGEAFPVTDLAGLSTKKLSIITKNTRIFMIQSHEGYCGLLIDRVLGLQHISKENKSKHNTSVLSPEYIPYMIGSIVISSSQLPIISCKAIVQHPRFRDCVLNEDDLAEVEK